MTLGTLFFVALLIACPVGMMFMMRGGHTPGGDGPGPNAADRDRRIADLEEENARLRGAASTAEAPELIGPRS